MNQTGSGEVFRTETRTCKGDPFRTRRSDKVSSTDKIEDIPNSLLKDEGGRRLPALIEVQHDQVSLGAVAFLAERSVLRFPLATSVPEEVALHLLLVEPLDLFRNLLFPEVTEHLPSGLVGSFFVP